MATLITGSSKGIGQALAFEFAKHGHDLILCARDKIRLDELAQQIKSTYSVNVSVIALDLSKSKSALTLIKIIEEQQYLIDNLVNNAGIGYLGDFTAMDSNGLDALLQLNIVTVSELTRYFAHRFLQTGKGKILQVSSTAAFQPGPYMAAYYASKSYVTFLSQAVAFELKGTGVSLSILHPGPTQTNFFHSAGMDDSFLAKGFLGVMSAEKVAEIAYKGFMKNKLFIIPGIMNKLLAHSVAITPTAISQRIIAFLHRK